MSVSFYAADKELDDELNVSVFNAEIIFKMLSIEGETDQGTIGSLDVDKCKKALESLDCFVYEHIYEANPLQMDRVQYLRYNSDLNRILGFCIGRNCEFR